MAQGERGLFLGEDPVEGQSFQRKVRLSSHLERDSEIHGQQGVYRGLDGSIETHQLKVEETPDQKPKGYGGYSREVRDQMRRGSYELQQVVGGGGKPSYIEVKLDPSVDRNPIQGSELAQAETVTEAGQADTQVAQSSASVRLVRPSGRQLPTQGPIMRVAPAPGR